MMSTTTRKTKHHECDSNGGLSQLCCIHRARRSGSHHGRYAVMVVGLVACSFLIPVTFSFQLSVKGTHGMRRVYDEGSSIDTYLQASNIKSKRSKILLVLQQSLRTDNEFDNKDILEEPDVITESSSSSSSLLDSESLSAASTITTTTTPEITSSALTLVLTLCFFVTALSALDRVAMSVAMIPLSNELGFSETVKGQISAAFSLGYGVAIIPAGLLVSSVSPRLVLAVGVALWSVATILTPWAATGGGIGPLLLVRGTVGAAESLVLPTIQTFQANWVKRPDQRSVAVATVFCGFQTGTIAAYCWSPTVMDWMGGGWRQLFFVYGAIGLFYLIPWWTLAQDSPPQQQVVVEVEGTTIEESAIAAPLPQDCKLTNTMSGDDASLLLECEPSATPLPSLVAPLPQDCKLTNTMSGDDASLLLECEPSATPLSPQQPQSPLQTFQSLLSAAPWRGILTSPGVWAVTAAHAANNWGLYNNLSWSPTFYAETYGLNVRESSTLSLLPALAGAAGGLLSGNLADKVLEWSLNQAPDEDAATAIEATTTRVRKVFQGVALLGPALLLANLSWHLPENDPTTAQYLLTGAVGLQSFNAAGYGPATQEKAGERWAGLLYSITSLPGVVFGTFGVYLTGRILDTYNNNSVDISTATSSSMGWSTVFGLNACVNVMGALLFIFLYDSKREFE